MKLKTIKIKDIFPYERNPRKNDKAVDAVVKSIEQCSYVAPIVVDENHVILDVIIERWERFTGEKAVLIEEGE